MGEGGLAHLALGQEHGLHGPQGHRGPFQRIAHAAARGIGQGGVHGMDAGLRITPFVMGDGCGQHQADGQHQQRPAQRRQHIEQTAPLLRPGVPAPLGRGVMGRGGLWHLGHAPGFCHAHRLCGSG